MFIFDLSSAKGKERKLFCDFIVCCDSQIEPNESSEGMKRRTAGGAGANCLKSRSRILLATIMIAKYVSRRKFNRLNEISDIIQIGFEYFFAKAKTTSIVIIPPASCFTGEGEKGDRKI